MQLKINLDYICESCDTQWIESRDCKNKYISVHLEWNRIINMITFKNVDVLMEQD